MLNAVEFDHDSLVARQRHEEIHPLSRDGPRRSPLPSAVGVVVQIDLRDEDRQVEAEVPVQTGAGAQDEPLGAVEPRRQPSMTIKRDRSLVVARVCFAPPCDELPPREPGVVEWSVVDQAVLGICRDLDVVVHDAAKIRFLSVPCAFVVSLASNADTTEASDGSSNSCRTRRPIPSNSGSVFVLIRSSTYARLLL